MWEFPDHQIHVTADVAIGVWHYYLQSQDLDYMIKYGAEVVLETAKYWSGRVDKVKGKKGYQICCVMGPDEYKVHTDNNAFTNYVAKQNLIIARDLMNIIKKKKPKEYKKLLSKVSIKEKNLQEFAKIANGIPIPIDKKSQIVWQCDGFQDFPEIDIDKIWEDKSKPFGLYVSQEQRFRSKVMKQSDTVALFMVYPDAFTHKQKSVSLDYYNKFNTHDSSNSMCSQAVVACDIKRPALAYEAWQKSVDIDFGRFPRASDGLHGVNCGGMWQEMIHGFAGMKSLLNSETLSFNPCLPKQFNKISFKIVWKDAPVKVTITKKGLELENLSKTNLKFKYNGKSYSVQAGKTKSI
jgi:kojibiose phosphorylase